METRGGRVHHAYGRCAPYIRNSRTIHAVPMHHHPRFCCSLGAAYAVQLDGATTKYSFDNASRTLTVPLDSIAPATEKMVTFSVTVNGIVKKTVHP